MFFFLSFFHGMFFSFFGFETQERKRKKHIKKERNKERKKGKKFLLESFRAKSKYKR